ncbi:3-oxo-5-alpha-steroid 4-dehydrogenase 2-like isoform 2-T2 [Pholidichthys leucotaenia]
MDCLDSLVSFLSWALILGGLAFMVHQTRTRSPYGRYVDPSCRCCSARISWFLQEVPAFILPLMMMMEENQESQDTWIGRTVLVWTFMLHYFQRGHPVPLKIVVSAAIFCSLNGFLQGHFLLHCSHFDDTWMTKIRMTTGFLIFLLGLTINIHSDQILIHLRKPGEVIYRIPKGGMFEYVSAANFFGEMVEWFGYAIVVWDLPAFAFAFFTVCSLGPRAVHHHRDYQRRFKDYPPSRKALIPFIL